MPVVRKAATRDPQPAIISGLCILLCLALITCEKSGKSDRPLFPFSITSPLNGSTVWERVPVRWRTADQDVPERVEFWVDGQLTSVLDGPEDSLLDWNTTSYENGSSHRLVLKMSDVDQNVTVSDTVIVIVDNTLAHPQDVPIISTGFSRGGFDITWRSSKDSDFNSYTLEQSQDASFIDYVKVYSTTDINDTSFRLTEVDPLIPHYFRAMVTDTFGFQTHGPVEMTSPDPAPSPVDVVLVAYTPEELRISWEQSPDGDFKNYRVLYSKTKRGEKDTLVNVRLKSQTTHVIDEFDPTRENWFWVLVADTLGQTSIGKGMSNKVDKAPVRIHISSINYDLNEMTVLWEESPDPDFQSYELLHSTSIAGPKTPIAKIEEKSHISHKITEFDPYTVNWFWLRVKDMWGRSSIGRPYRVVEGPPTEPELKPAVYRNDSFTLSWSENRERDFKSYKLFQSVSEDKGRESVIFETGDRTQTNYSLRSIRQNERRYYRLEVTDIFGFTTSSLIVEGNSYQKIVFMSDRDGNWEIYMMDMDGENQRNLTNHPANDMYPWLSPDGSKIAFVSDRDKNIEIYIMEADGTKQTNVTNHPREEWMPRFSPDGARIGFMSDRDGRWRSYVMDLAGENLREVRTRQEWDYNVVLSSDQTRIVYEKSVDQNMEIFLANKDLSNPTNLTRNRHNDRTPRFLPIQ